VKQETTARLCASVRGRRGEEEAEAEAEAEEKETAAAP